MVLKTEVCRFSGLRVYPGHGMKLARTDGQVFLFLNAKAKRLYNNKKKPSKLAWTALFRKQHKKDQATETTRKKRRAVRTTATRAIVGASLEVIQKRRTEKSEVRAAARDAALREVKERAKVAKADKVARKAADDGNKLKAASKHVAGAKPAKMGKASKR